MTKLYKLLNSWYKNRLHGCLKTRSPPKEEPLYQISAKNKIHRNTEDNS